MMTLNRFSLGRVMFPGLFSRSTPLLRTLIGGTLGTLGIIAWGAIAPEKMAIAQIIPDLSLGSEHSIVSPDVFSPHGAIDRIDGGAIRGQNLFHSFSDFNVNPQQRVYFSNPAVIDNIVSRVTGTTPSDIFGTLGVLGNANLFLINPNGIVFGPDAVLDLSGSLVASTADHIAFADGYRYSAITANAPPLLNVHSPIAGLTSWLPQSGQIQTSGDLAVGQNLVFTAGHLDIQGRLGAGENLSAIATNQLTATDTTTIPLALSAGQQLLLQGNQSLNISALDHPLSGIRSGHAMTLRSNAPIVGDAIFTAGGNIRIERVDGSLGSMISIKDPVFQTSGDFSVDSYTGASLQILTGGSVTIPGDISIDAAGGPFNDSTVEVSDGTSVTLSGTTEPTVDIRAGTTKFFGTPDASSSPTSADITIGTITNPGGTVFLTNQFQPNSDRAGDISIASINTVDFNGGGSVIIDSRGGIISGGVDVSGGDLGAFLAGDIDALGGNGGEIKFLADQDITIPHQSFISSYGLQGGTITFESGTAIIQEDGPFGSSFDQLSFIESITSGSQRGGDLTLSAPRISIGGNVFVDTYGGGDSGALIITGDSLVTHQASINTDTFGAGDSGVVRVNVNSISVGVASSLGSVASGPFGGKGGDVVIQADSITVSDGGQIGSNVDDIFGTGGIVGDAGDVTISAQDITVSGFLPEIFSEETFVASLIFSSTTDQVTEASSGNLSISTNSLTITDGATVSTSSFSSGRAGELRINASDRIVVDGAILSNANRSEPSSISSELFTGAVGEGGRVAINTPILELTNGGSITTLSDGNGPSGSIDITVTDSILVDGAVLFPQDGVDDRFSRIAVLTESESTGNAGQIQIDAPAITLSNGGQITAESRGTGRGGNIAIISGTLILERAGLISAETVSNSGGDIFLNIDDVITMTGESRISATAGTADAGGDGGNITIETTFVTAEPEGNNDITANAFDGRGGRVDITAEGIFGLIPRSRPELESLLGTTDPTQLDPINLPTSDITAISQSNPSLDGVVVIRSPDVDPSRSIIELPSNVTDASRLITQGCSAGGAIAQEVGSLIVTGRGGLPQNPSEGLSHPDLILEWERVPPTGPSTGSSIGSSVAPPVSSSIRGDLGESGGDRSETGQIVEVQSLRRRADGTVVLTAHAPSSTLSNTLSNTLSSTPSNIHHSGWNPQTTCVSPIP